MFATAVCRSGRQGV